MEGLGRHQVPDEKGSDYPAFEGRESSADYIILALRQSEPDCPGYFCNSGGHGSEFALRKGFGISVEAREENICIGHFHRKRRRCHTPATRFHQLPPQLVRETHIVPAGAHHRMQCGLQGRGLWNFTYKFFNNRWHSPAIDREYPNNLSSLWLQDHRLRLKQGIACKME